MSKCRRDGGAPRLAKHDIGVLEAILNLTLEVFVKLTVISQDPFASIVSFKPLSTWDSSSAIVPNIILLFTVGKLGCIVVIAGLWVVVSVRYGRQS